MIFLHKDPYHRIPAAARSTTPVACPNYTGPATLFLGNQDPTGRLNPTSLSFAEVLPGSKHSGPDPTTGDITNNYTTATSGGGNQNQVVGRLDHNFSAKQRIFFRDTYWNVLDLPVDPLGTGLCADRCSETYLVTRPPSDTTIRLRQLPSSASMPVSAASRTTARRN